MRRLRALLSQPNPSHATPRAYLLAALGLSAGVTLLLALFEPFGIHEIETPGNWWVGLAFGGVTLGVMLLHLGLIFLLPRWFDPQRWTLGKELVWSAWHFLLIGLANYHFATFLYGPSPDRSYGGFLLATLLVGLVPYLILSLALHLHATRTHLRAALQMHTHLDRQLRSQPQDVLLPLGEKVVPAVRLSELRYIESRGNYLHLWLRHADRIQEVRLRGTLKDMAVQLAPYPEIFRCHRAYLVNLAHVTAIEGNAAGYLATVDLALPPVPVSRSYGRAFQDTLRARSNA